MDKNKNNRIDSEDFKLLRKSKKHQTDEEMEEGNAFTGALAKAKDSGDDEFEVDFIISFKEEDGKIKYRVRWKNYPDQDTFEPRSNIGAMDEEINLLHASADHYMKVEYHAFKFKKRYLRNLK